MTLKAQKFVSPFEKISHSALPTRRAACAILLPFWLALLISQSEPAWSRIRSPTSPSADAEEASTDHCILAQSEGRVWLQKTLQALRRKEGGWVGARVRNGNGSFDLGPMQVNDWWVPKIAALIGRDVASVRFWLTFDACFNVSTAKWIFLSALAQTQDYWRAVGIYHSPTRWRQLAYARDIALLLQRDVRRRPQIRMPSAGRRKL